MAPRPPLSPGPSLPGWPARTSKTRCVPCPRQQRPCKLAVSAADREGVPLVLNARTDAFLAPDHRERARGGPRRCHRPRPGLPRRRCQLRVRARHLDAPTISQLVDAFSHGRLSVIGTPGGSFAPRTCRPRRCPSVLRALSTAPGTQGPHRPRRRFAVRSRLARQPDRPTAPFLPTRAAGLERTGRR